MADGPMASDRLDEILSYDLPDPITPSFFTGDVVTLKSGGPQMTVLWQMTTPQALMECRRKGWPDGAVSVEWLDSVGHRHSHKYHPLQLIKAQQTEGKDETP